MAMKRTLYNKKWSEKQTQKGLCIWCKNKKLKHSNLCEKHYFIVIAQSTLGDRRMAEQIRELYFLQDGKCYITGEKLILGENAGLGHLLPQKKRPDLKNDINNVRWVDKKINEMKRDLTTTEFIDICKKIAKIHNK